MMMIKRKDVIKWLINKECVEASGATKQTQARRKKRKAIQWSTDSMDDPEERHVEPQWHKEKGE